MKTNKKKNEMLLETPCGAIQGTSCQHPGVHSFRGVRYATAGRWEYPQVVERWDGVYDATKYGACSYQPRAFFNEEDMPEKVFYYNEFRRGEVYGYDEDCLFLNIWTPADATPESRLPVLFYIHGGGFTGGCGHEKHFDGPVWPTQGVVGVTINYRLGPMGFLFLPELEKEAGHSGNYGLFDQVAALQWVQRNIAAFGGDPENVTVMGQSAGAMSVQCLCVSPLTGGLFSKAVMSSGGGVTRMLDVASPVDRQYAFWQKVMERAGCGTLKNFRRITPGALFEAWQQEKAEQSGRAQLMGPCLDGVLLTKSALAAAQDGEQKNIPYMMGSTSHDVMPPFLFKMARDWCRMQADQGKQQSYAWFFDRKLPGDENGAWHSSDLWYWFGTLDRCWRPMTDKDAELSRQMSAYLANFARTGNPNGSGLTQWLPVEKGQNKVLRLGEKDTRMGGVNIAKLNYTMLTNKAVGE